MTDLENPYRAPDADLVAAPVEARHDQVDVAAMIAWPTVFAMNMFLPVLFGLDLTKHHGRIGMCVASLFVLIAGWVLCVVKSLAARKLIFGSLIIALTQIFPILQILAGSLALGIAEGMQLLSPGVDDDHNFGIAQIDSEFVGFVVTMLVAVILLGCASMAGLIASLILPFKWFKPLKNANPEASIED